ncbi:hypothetical protein ACLMJK_004266 [Lecanora helva]
MNSTYQSEAVPAVPAPTQASNGSVQPKAAAQSVPASNHHLSDGAVGGIVVGVAIGIALLATLITFLIMKRQKKARKGRDPHLSREKARDEMNHTSKVPEPTSGEGLNIDKYLPQSTDDKTLAGKTNSVFDQIEIFVENFYSTKALSNPSASDNDLAQFHTADLPNNLTALLSQSSNAQTLITHALSHFLFSRISSGATVRESLLPRDLALIPWSLNLDSQRARLPGRSVLLYRWRTLSAYLRPDPSSDKDYLADRDRKIAVCVQSFTKAFAPWSSKKYPDEERMQSLAKIFQQGAALGLLLFSQPAELQFTWPQKVELQRGGLALTPNLCKYADQWGQKLSHAQTITESRKATIT